MSSIITQGSASGTGSMTLLAPNTNSNQVALIPDVSGTVMVSGAMPAFSAYLLANQAVTSGTFTKITINTKEFDTSNSFDNVTNYRYQPLVAGYYLITATVYPSTTTTETLSSIYKNGSAYKTINLNGSNEYALISCLVQMNGSTDYLELYGLLAGTSPSINANSWFQGVLVRAA